MCKCLFGHFAGVNFSPDHASLCGLFCSVWASQWDTRQGLLSWWASVCGVCGCGVCACTCVRVRVHSVWMCSWYEWPGGRVTEMKVSADFDVVVGHVSCHCKVSLGLPISHPLDYTTTHSKHFSINAVLVLPAVQQLLPELHGRPQGLSFVGGSPILIQAPCSDMHSKSSTSWGVPLPTSTATTDIILNPTAFHCDLDIYIESRLLPI